MDDELLGYYNAELSYLRELGGEFARKYPKVANRLLLEADKCEDPHVERLLEGVAFLTARVRQKIDDEFPEVTDSLLGLVYPHYNRPIPSVSIVQMLLGPEQAEARKGYTVPRGAALASPPVGGLACRFQTAYPVTLWPIELAAAKLDPDRVVVPNKPIEATSLITLGLRCTGGANFNELGLDRLRFHLDGTGPNRFALYELLLNNACGIQVRGKRLDGTPTVLNLPRGAIKPVGFERDEGLLPAPNNAFGGYRLLQEYFALPEKFLFFDVVGLGAVPGSGLGPEADLLIFLNRPPAEEVPVGAETFRLGCTPIVNLFPKVADPIALTQSRYEYRVVPDVHFPAGLEVYSIERVTGVDSFLSEPIGYEPFFSLRHGAGDQREKPAYWYATRRPSPRKEDPGTEVYLAFVDPEFNPRLPTSQAITVHALCTNRGLPARLPFGGERSDLSVEGHAPVSRVRYLRRPTQPLYAPSRRGALWRLISHLSLNHLSLVDDDQGLDALREILAAYDFADTAVNRQQIRGIVGVRHDRIAGRVPRLNRAGHAVGNAVCLGVEVELEFDEANFVGSGVFLLASVLERFLGQYVTINSFTQLVAKTRQREGVLKRWPSRAGARTLL